MSVELSQREKEIFNNAYDYGLKNLAPNSYKWEQEGTVERTVFDDLYKAGYCGMGLRGYGYLDMALAYEGLSHGCGSMTFFLQLHNNISFEIGTFYETSDKVKSLVPLMATGKLLTAFAFTEEGAGSDPSSTKSVAVLKEDGYHVTGKKSWIANALEADYFNLIVKDETRPRGMLMLLVDKNTKGFNISKNIRRMGGNVISCADLEFDDIVVDKDMLLSTEGFKEALKAIDVARIFVPAICVGIAQRCIDITVKRLANRTAFGKSIFSNQYVQFKLAELSAKVEAARWLVYRVASARDKNENISVIASMNKYLGPEVALNVATECVQLWGAEGFVQNSEVARNMALAKMLQIVDGTSEICKMVIGRNLEKN